MPRLKLAETHGAGGGTFHTNELRGRTEGRSAENVFLTRRFPSTSPVMNESTLKSLSTKNTAPLTVPI
jgi:hypothetical protein